MEILKLKTAISEIPTVLNNRLDKKEDLVEEIQGPTQPDLPELLSHHLVPF